MSAPPPESMTMSYEPSSSWSAGPGIEISYHHTTKPSASMPMSPSHSSSTSPVHSDSSHGLRITSHVACPALTGATAAVLKLSHDEAVEMNVNVASATADSPPISTHSVAV